MKTVLAMAAMLAASCVAASGNEGYDRRIDAAAARIVAAKIGDLRGSFGADEAPVFVMLVDAGTTGSIRYWRGGWNEGIARAREAMPLTRASY